VNKNALDAPPAPISTTPFGECCTITASATSVGMAYDQR
jgi:hypothetical protein